MPLAHHQHPGVDEVRHNDYRGNKRQIVYNVKHNTGTERIPDIKTDVNGRVDEWEHLHGHRYPPEYSNKPISWR